MKRKGQAAMEYLMTYGWAILIIIVVIGALWKMGVFSTSPTVTCSPFFRYFAYRDYAGGTLKLRNGPQTVNITSVVGGDDPTTTQFTAGQDVTIDGIATTGDVDLTLTYTNVDSGLSHTDTATIHN